MIAFTFKFITNGDCRYACKTASLIKKLQLNVQELKMFKHANNNSKHVAINNKEILTAIFPVLIILKFA